VISRLHPASSEGPTQPRTYLVDGHNLLYACRQAFLDQLTDGHPGAAARAELVRRLVTACPPPGPALFVYFDGAEPNTEHPANNVQVIYSGGHGDQRADRAIVRHVNAHLAGGSRPDAQLVVVTRDIKLARRARKRDAAVMDPGEFLQAWKIGGGDTGG
jgi:predicted RNA-binding protein with PIN domain